MKLGKILNTHLSSSVLISYLTCQCVLKWYSNYFVIEGFYPLWGVRFSAVKILLGGCLAGPGGCNQSYCCVCCFACVFPNENHWCGLSCCPTAMHVSLLVCCLKAAQPWV